MNNAGLLLNFKQPFDGIKPINLPVSASVAGKNGAELLPQLGVNQGQLKADGFKLLSQATGQGDRARNVRQVEREVRQLKWENGNGKFEINLSREIVTETSSRELSCTVSQSFRRSF